MPHIVFQLSDFIALGAVLVASLSAIYAKRTVVTSEKANRIAIHNERLKLYKALLVHHAHLAGRGIPADNKQAWLFYESAQLAEFYYPDHHARVFLKIFDDTLKVLILKDQWEEARSDQAKYSDLVQRTHKLHQTTRDLCGNLADELKPLLRVGT